MCLDPDQARSFVRIDLGPNCLQRLSADHVCLLLFKGLLTICMLGNLACFFVICGGFFFFFFFFKLTFSKGKSFRNTIRVSNSLDPDQARRFVRPDLGPNCLQRLSADNRSRH